MAASDGTESAEAGSVTAGMLVIGDEILSGRTKDKNIGFVAEYLTGLGIDLREVRIVPDIADEIVAALNALRHRYTYVFTSGGIGPTHDDITADCVAAAFGVEIGHDPRAVEILTRHFAERGVEANEARMRMARIPQGADLIENRVSRAPGFRIGNVHVMAGVPSVLQAMMDAVAPTLKGGRRLLSESIDTRLGEGTIAADLGAIQKAHPGTMIGSYPYFDGSRHATNVVVRARDPDTLAAAAAEVRAMVDRLNAPKP
ncbi:competence/damage-inducible protein A [Prosthecomicrobium sp. N25]|uniref:competence/damage-inducible protein A n=1 Tax=Prosthecomicrobium sp. N25 TaxID=3129254 RepID=UPI003077696D